jgi:hemolysin activation/secretion protein
MGTAAVVAVSGFASAAPLPLPGAVQPGRDRPLPEAPSAPEYDFRLESPQRSPVPRAVDEIHFRLNDIRIVGAVTLPPEQFRPLHTALIGKDVTLSDILNIADIIEAKYRAAGYLLVRAYVPPQRVKDGVFTIDVVEGYVASVSVEGSNEGAQSATKAYLEPVLDEKPLRMETMERALLLTNDLPGISATGVLKPSATTTGASDLVVSELQPLWNAGFSVNNRGSRFSGLWTTTASGAINGIFGADQLAAAFTISPDQSSQMAGQLRYRRPIGDDGLIGSIFGVITHGQPGSSLSALGVNTDSWAVGPRLTYPLIRSRAETLSFDGGFTFQDARVNAAGVPNSHDQWRVLDVSVNYLNSNFLDGAWYGTLDLAQGLPIFGASPNGCTHPGQVNCSNNLSRVGAHTDFTKFVGAAHVTWPLIDALGTTLAMQGQYAFAPLVNGEQIAFGGLQIGSGYDPGAITGDNGIGGKAEIHYDTRIPSWSIQALQPYVFVDGAATWYIHGGPAVGLLNYTISSVGGGLRFWFPYNIAGDVEVDRTLNAVPGSDGNHQATKVLMDVAVNF